MTLRPWVALGGREAAHKTVSQLHGKANRGAGKPVHQGPSVGGVPCSVEKTVLEDEQPGDIELCGIMKGPKNNHGDSRRGVKAENLEE